MANTAPNSEKRGDPAIIYGLVIFLGALWLLIVLIQQEVIPI